MISFFFRSNTNCGGNGFSFLFVEGDTLIPCDSYQWRVTATYTDTATSEVLVSSLDSCVYTVLEAPHDGKCTLSYNLTTISSGGSVSVPELSRVTVECSDWKVGCSDGVGGLFYGTYVLNGNGDVFVGNSIESTFDFFGKMIYLNF